MAKRFTDNEKWNKKFIRSLPPFYKLLWLYILDECNHSGIWDVDFEVAQVKIGAKLKISDALIFLKDKIIPLDDGQKWFIPSFIEFQYGQLSCANRAHAKTILLLKKFNLINEDLEISPFSKSPKPLCDFAKGDKVEVEGKEEVEEMEKDKGGAGENHKKSFQEKDQETLTMPFDTVTFVAMWGHWKIYKEKQHRFKFLSVQTEQAALKKLADLAAGNESKALDIIEQSIAQGWKGLFELKNEENERTANNTNKNGRSTTGSTAAAFAAIDAMPDQDGNSRN